MKTIVSLLPILLVFPPLSETRAQVFWFQLTGNRVILDAVVAGVRGDSLLLDRAGRRTFVPMRDIERIRITQESSILEGAVVGAGAGVAAGALLGTATGGSNDDNWNPGTTMMFMGVLGGIVGSIIGSADDEGTVLVLGGMTIAQKKESILNLLAGYSERSDRTSTDP